VYKNTVIHSKTIKIGPQFLLEVRMAHTVAACSLWQSTVTWQHCPKMFYNGRRMGWRTTHTTHTIIPASISFCLCNLMRSKRMTERKCSQCHVLGLFQQLLNINKKSLNGLYSGWETVTNQ
jgi:hypothetical protein